jgi:hypothetical protein
VAIPNKTSRKRKEGRWKEPIVISGMLIALVSMLGKSIRWCNCKRCI